MSKFNLFLCLFSILNYHFKYLKSDNSYRASNTDFLNFIKSSIKNDELNELFKRNNILNERIFFNSFVGPTCIPLVSKNIKSNPYHSSLLSLSGAQLRKGLGFAALEDASEASLNCPNDMPEPCVLSISKSVSLSIHNSYSISQGNGVTFSKVFGSTKTKSKGNAFTKSISKSLEQSLSQTISSTDEETLSNQIAQALQKSHEKSSGISKTDGKENAATLTLSEDSTNSRTLSSEQTRSDSKSRESTNSRSEGGSKQETFGYSVTATANFIFGSASASHHGSFTSENNWNNQKTESHGESSTNSMTKGESNLVSKSNGKSNSNTISQSSSSTKDNRESDSISSMHEASRSNGTSKSKTTSDTKTITNTYRVDDTYTSTEDTQMSVMSNQEESVSDTNTLERSISKSHQLTVTFDQTFRIAKGACKMATCKLVVSSLIIPFECIDATSGQHEIDFVELMIVDESKLHSMNGTSLSCIKTLIDCNQNPNEFLVLNEEFTSTSNDHSYLNYGQHLSINTVNIDEPYSNRQQQLRSANGKYTLELEASGNLVIKQYELIYWKNGMDMFDSSYQLRLRINEKGHLVQETMGLFSNTVPGYRQGEWVQVWSSVPLNHADVTIGLAKYKDNNYKLVLANNGQLNLYDSVGTLIWCSGLKCKHRLGYKFPEVYLVPMNMITPRELTDPHNNILNETSVLLNANRSFMMSLDFECTSKLLSSSDQNALVSPNGRFKLLLEESGNLVLKDEYRTMWESLSGHLAHVHAPFELVLSPSSGLLIVSSNGYIAWKTLISVDLDVRNNSTNMEGWSFKLSLLDEGRLVITDRFEKEIWESWPTRNMSDAYTIFKPVEYVFVPCDGKARYTKQRLQSTTLIEKHEIEEASEFSNDDKLYFNERLISSIGYWDLIILNRKELVLRKLNIVVYCVFNLSLIETNENALIEYLFLKNTGDLIIKYQMKSDNHILLTKEHLIWKNIFKLSDANYTLELDEFGFIKIQENFNKTIYILNQISQTEVKDQLPLLETIRKNYLCKSQADWSEWTPCTNNSTQTRSKYALKLSINNKTKKKNYECMEQIESRACKLYDDYNVRANSRMKNKKLYESINISPSKCWKRCQRDKLCVGITFLNDARCYLITQDYELVWTNKWTSYLKKSVSIDCQVGDWSEWTSCTNNVKINETSARFDVFESEHFKMRIRNIKRPNENFGLQCPPLVETTKCN